MDRSPVHAHHHAESSAPGAVAPEAGPIEHHSVQGGAVPPVAPERSGGDQASASERAFMDTHRTASHGIRGGGAPLPFAAQIAASVGPAHAPTVHAITAHVGGAANEATTAMGAHAYATGDQVAFATTPTLHMAAHEAAHVIQQRGGVQLEGGVGTVGDAHEQHADAVADRVVEGRSAADLLGPATGSPASGPAPVQFLKKYEGPLNRGTAQAVDEFSKTYPDGGDSGNLKTRGGFADKTVRVACDYHVGVRDPISGKTVNVRFHGVEQDRGVGMFTSMMTFGQYDTRKDVDSDVLKCEGIEYKTKERYSRSSGFMEKFSEPTGIQQFAATEIPALARRIARFEQTGETGNTPQVDARDNAELLAARANR